MPAAIHLSALACALGAVVFAVMAGRSRLAWGATALGLVVALAWPQAATSAAGTGATGLVLALLAVSRLAGWDSKSTLGLASGLLAGSWATLLAAQGVPWWVAVAMGVAVPGLAVVQSGRPGFAPARLCEDALVVVAVVGLCAAAAPGLWEGWRAAVNLKFGGVTQAATAVPVWTVAVTLAAVAAGAGYGAWSRR